MSDTETADERIRELQLEQSAELPDGVIRSLDMNRVCGDILHRSQPDKHHVLVTIAWPEQNHGHDITQFLNILFGNISMKRGIAIINIRWEDIASHLFSGPAWGIDRIRNEWNIPKRALSCTALKPMGYSTSQLSTLAYEFALGGIDIIKDDHGLADQQTAPFKERVKACTAAMDRAAQINGRRSRYFPNITSEPHLAAERYEQAAELGADGVLLTPMLAGPALMHRLARSTTDLPIMAHPAFSGTLIAHNPFVQWAKKAINRPETTDSNPPYDTGKESNEQTDHALHNHGFEAGVFFGGLWRALGADFVIYPNAGGRFAYSLQTCESINHEARRNDLPFPPSFPTPGGGMQRDKMPYWLDNFGMDTTFLVGGSLYEDPEGIEAASRSIMETIR